MHATLGTLIPFVLPSLGVLIFLLLTEKKRHKPWVIEAQEVAMERHVKAYTDPRREQRGLLSGALWIVAFAFFLLSGFVVGWKYALLVLLFAFAGEILIEYWLQSRQV